MKWTLLITAAVLTALGSARAEEPAGVSVDPDYRTCVAHVEADPKAGRTHALRWISDGGGAPAIHCAAVADLALDQPRLAAARLAPLADRTALTDPSLAARLYLQTAQAWALGGKETLALQAIDSAYSMAPAAAEVDLEAAPIYAELGRWGLVKRALDKADREAPLGTDALVLRGRAKLELADPAGAADDTRAALNLQPDNIAGLVLRGELAQLGHVIEVY